jgi:hypothetical protein
VGRAKLAMPKHPTHKAVKFSTMETAYGAPFFRDALSRGLTDSQLSAAQIEREGNTFDVSFNAVPVFQRIKFSTSDHTPMTDRPILLLILSMASLRRS